MNQTYVELSSAAEGREPRSHRAGREDLGEAFRPGFRLLRNLAHQVQLWRERAHQRRELMSLGEDGLKDIGLGYSEAYREYDKPFWRS